MSLSSSLFSGVSGLSTMGNAMTVIGDNIANVNTVGFKSSRATFQDVLSQTVATQSGTSQVGRGSTLGDIVSIFGQGSFESTESPTDLAIGGDGFFIVRHPENEDSEFFTRAGEFRFNKDGYFVNPAGYIVQGWELQRNETTGDVEDVGSLTDVRLASFTSPPETTDRVTIITNLDSRGDDNSEASASNPYPLSTIWNGDITADSPIADSAYEYQTTVKVYDSLGSTHDITVYFDSGDKTATESTYEYIVTCNPAEDRRNIFDDPVSDAGIGLLGRGLITFDSSGILKDMTFEKFVGNSGGSAVDATSLPAWPGSGPVLYSGAAGITDGDYTITATNGGTIGTDAISLSVSDAAGNFYTTITIPATYSGEILTDSDGLGLGFSFTVGDDLAIGDDFVFQADAGTATVTIGGSNFTNAPTAYGSSSGTSAGAYTFTVTGTGTGTNAGTIGTDLITLHWDDGTTNGDITIPAGYETGEPISGPGGMVLTFTAGEVVDDGSTGNAVSTFTATIAGTASTLTVAADDTNVNPVVSGEWTGTVGGDYTFTATAGTIGTDEITLTVTGPGGGAYADIVIPATYADGDVLQGPDGLELTFSEDEQFITGQQFAVTVGAGDPDDLTDEQCWAAMSTNDLTNQHFTFNPDFLGGTQTELSIELDFGAKFGGTAWNPESLSTTQYASASTTIFQSSTGYGAGDLQSVSVDVDGVITGQYSNGQVMPLFRVGLAKFQNIQGLYKEGGSLYKETRNSGSAITGKPGTNGLGSIAPNSLEQSNVDMAQEFVKMITTQRGYQANSKIITTVDSMLNEVINLKR